MENENYNKQNQPEHEEKKISSWKTLGYIAATAVLAMGVLYGLRAAVSHSPVEEKPALQARTFRTDIRDVRGENAALSATLSDKEYNKSLSGKESVELMRSLGCETENLERRMLENNEEIRIRSRLNVGTLGLADFFGTKNSLDYCLLSICSIKKDDESGRTTTIAKLYVPPNVAQQYIDSQK